MINAALGKCFISPVQVDSEDYGVFAWKKIKAQEVLWINGPFSVPHSEVCAKLGVEPKLEADPTRRSSSRNSTPQRFVATRSPRHIHSYLQSLKNLENEDDFGHQDNMEHPWCDLAANYSPTLFLNSITPEDGRRHNVIFEVFTDHTGVEFSQTTAIRDIEPLDEVVGDYMMNKNNDAPKRGKGKKRKRNSS